MSKRLQNKSKNNYQNIHKNLLKKSASSSFLGKHHHRCMCQVCTCHRPDHKCPINYINPKFNGKTNYQHEYTKHRTEKPDIWVAKDNLVSNKLFNGNTEYRNQYKNRKGRGSLLKDHEVKEKW